MGVSYCHWKSNVRPEASLAGEEDLDLLVSRDDAAAFQAALAENDFRLALSRNGIGHPGVFHAFALDIGRRQLVHVHAYFQVVTGDSLVKSYHFPIQHALLAAERRLFNVRVPPPEVELVLFLLRVALKHTSLVEVLLVNRGYNAISQELAWLRAAANENQAAELWDAWVPGAGRDLLRDLMAAVENKDALARRVFLGMRVAWHVRRYRRISIFPAAVSRLRRVMVLLLRRIRKRRELTLQTGGMIIACVGPKASGKSTLSKAVAGQLGRHFDVRQAHVGKPPPTVLSFLPALLVPLARRLIPKERSGEYELAERRQEGHYSFIHVLRMALLAYDRRAMLRRCWRAACTGSIVLTDRYPSGTAGAIDSSRFDDAAVARCTSQTKRWMMKCERALYTGLPQPDLIIRLVAPIETTLRRDAERIKEDGPDPAALKRRWRMETEAKYPGAKVFEVSTEQPLDASLAKVLEAIWSSA
jgi:thymidylate kinase